MPHGHYQRVRLGLLGSGFVADFYMDGLRDVPGARVVANYSRTAERAREFGGRHDTPHQYTDIEPLCRSEDVELVVIGLPNHLHLEAVRISAAAGKAIVCTTPLARNGREAAEIVRIVNEAGIMHGYAETEVFAPNVMRARKMIEDGAIGEVITVRAREAHSGPHAPDSTATPVHGFITKPAGYLMEKADADTGWVYPIPEEAQVYGYAEELRHFVECFRTGAEPRETFVDGYVVNCALDACYRSMKIGRWEPIELDLEIVA